MLRALCICAITAFVCSCGGPSPDKSQKTSTAPEAVSPAGNVSTTALPPVSSPPRSNKYLQLAVTEAGFDPAGPAAPPGLRYYSVGLRGVGRARGNDFALEFQRFVFAQDERGCISRPIPKATWLKRPFGETA